MAPYNFTLASKEKEFKPEIKTDALISSLQIKYFLKNIHNQNIKKFVWKNNDGNELDKTKIFHDFNFMVSEIEKHFSIDLNSRTVKVPRIWKEIIEYRCSMSKIQSFINKTKNKKSENE